MEEAASRLSKRAGAKQLDSANWPRLAQALTEVACCLSSSCHTKSSPAHRQYNAAWNKLESWSEDR